MVFWNYRNFWKIFGRSLGSYILGYGLGLEVWDLEFGRFLGHIMVCSRQCRDEAGGSKNKDMVKEECGVVGKSTGGIGADD